MVTNNTKFELTGIDMNTKANIDSRKPGKGLDERAFIEHIMRRTLYSVLTRMSMLATRNPDGLIEDLKEIDLVKDNAFMWAKHVSEEMDIEGLFEHDKIMMHKICGKIE